MSSEREAAESRDGWLIAGALGMVGLVSLAMLLFPTTAKVAPEIEALRQVRRVTLACLRYESDRGAFPGKLEDLMPAYIDDEEQLFAKDKHGSLVPLVYHPGRDITESSVLPLVEFPFALRGRRPVGYVGGHATLIDERGTKHSP